MEKYTNASQGTELSSIAGLARHHSCNTFVTNYTFVTNCFTPVKLNRYCLHYGGQLTAALPLSGLAVQ